MKLALDLNLLLLAASLYRTLNVSKTAGELGLSQSAVSHALTKLRSHFGDPLFVRVAKGMAPTALAKELRPAIEDLVQKASELAQRTEAFDPARAKGRITLATTDLIEVVLMPSLLKRLATEAPNLQVSIRSAGGELPKQDLETGLVDIAIAGFFKNLPEGFYQTKVLDETFSTGYRKNHPTIRGKLTASQFYEREHALITLQGDFKDGLRSKTRGEKRERKFVFGSYSFTGLAWTLASTDLVLTAPTLLLKKYAEYFPIQVQEPPVETPKIEIRMVWHALTHRDPLRAWFRELLKAEFARL